MGKTAVHFSVENIIKLIKSQSSVLFVGAGISMSPPAGLPDWLKLRDFTLEALSEKDETISKYISKLTSKEMLSIPGKKGMTPEVVASVVTKHTIGYFNSLKAFENGHPNENHHLIALLAQKGYIKNIITTNFDTYIEKAFEYYNVEYRCFRSDMEFRKFEYLANPEKPQILKIHGCISVPHTITATVEKEAQGLSFYQSLAVQQLIQNHQILFWGYSGWDLKIDLNYLGMVSHKETAPGFVWSFYKNAEYTEPINPYVENLSSLYKERAVVGHMIIPVAIKSLDDINLTSIPKIKLLNGAEQKAWQNKINDTLLHSIKEWSHKNVSSPAACEIFADLLKISGLPNDALQCYFRKKDLTENNENNPIHIDTNIGIAKIYLAIGSLDTALEYYKHAEILATKQNDLNSLSIVHAELGDYYRTIGDTTLAIMYLEGAYKYANSIGYSQGANSILHRLSDVYLANNQFELALDYAKQAEKKWRLIGDMSYLLGSLRQQGAVYRSWGDFSQAKSCLNEALEIARTLGDQEGYDQIRYYLATLEIMSGKQGAMTIEINATEETKITLEEIVDNARNTSSIVFGDALYMLILVKEKLQEDGEARHLVNDLIKHLREVNNIPKLGPALNLRASLYVDENSTKSLNDAKEAMQLSEKSKSYLSAALSSEFIGNLYLEKFSKPDEAVNYYQKSISLHRQVEQDIEPWVLSVLPKIQKIKKLVPPSAVNIIREILGAEPLMEEVLVEIKGSDLEIDFRFEPHLKNLDQLLQELEKSSDISKRKVLYRIMRKAQLLGHDAVQKLETERARRLFGISKKIAVLEGFLHQETATLADIGWTRILDRDYKKGLPQIEKAYLMADELEDFRSAIIYIGNIGYTHGRMGNFDSAIHYLEKSIQLAREHRDQEREFDMLMELGVWLKDQKKIQAVQYLESALDIAYKKGDLETIANIYFNLGKVYRDTGKYQKALENRLHGLDILMQLNQKPENIAMRIIPIGVLYEEHLGQPEKAVELYEKSIGYAHLAGSIQLIENGIRLRKRAISKLDGAAKLPYPTYDKLLEIFKGENLALTSLEIAAKYSEFPQSFFDHRLFSRVLEVKRRSIPKAVGYTLELFSRYCFETNETEMALNLLEMATVIAKEIDDKTWNAEILFQKANIIRKTGNVEKAIEQYQEIEKFKILVNDWELDYSLYFQLGTAWMESGDLDKAKRSFQKALSDSIENNLISEQGHIHIMLANVNKQKSQYKAEEDELLLALELFHKSGTETDIINAKLQLGLAYTNLEKYELALDYLKPIRTKFEKQLSREIMNLIDNAIEKAKSAFRS